MQTHPIAPDYLAGAISYRQVDGGLMPFRLNDDERALYGTPGDKLIGRANCPAGVRLRVYATGDRLGLALRPDPSTPRQLDLVIANELIATADIPMNATEHAFDLPRDRDPAVPVEIWLSQKSPMTLTGILVSDGADIRPAPDTRPRWLTYGSSISQCATAHSPARTWPGIVARRHDLALTCMGFGGNCHMETMVARCIRDTPADLITLKLGINIQGHASLSPRTFAIAAVGLVRTIREKQPDTPIGLISPIVSPTRETTPNPVGMSLRDMRAHLRDAVTRLRDHGDARIWYHDGLDLFAPDQVDTLMPDGLHPNGDGYEHMGLNIAANVVAPLLDALRQPQPQG